MIRYDLCCVQGHLFDGWFANSQAYDHQRNAGLLECPQCGSAQIDKQLMTPGVPAKANRANADAPQKAVTGPLPKPSSEVVEALRAVKRHITENADYVGPKFAEEARRMHFGEAQARGIYGEASADEVASLTEEGIDVAPVPVLPDDHN